MKKQNKKQGLAPSEIKNRGRRRKGGYGHND